MKKAFLVSFLLIGALSLSACTLPKRTVTLKPEEVKAKAESFINENLVTAQNKVTVKNVDEENGLYKLTISFANGQETDSYISKDGKVFFPSAMDIAKTEQDAKDKTAAAEEAEKPVTKSAKPSVELFVMSYCPFGTQIEKGILPVLDTLKDKIDFKLEFCDYAMHEKKEIDENLTQYCIQKDFPDKLKDYLFCFLGEGKSADCITQTKLDSAKIASCVKSTDTEFKVTANYNDKSTWKGQFPPFNVNKDLTDKYAVKGSPTLVINGTQVSSNRDPQSLLNTICSAFETLPEECSKQLATAQPSSGFGYGESDPTAAQAGCSN